MRRERRVFEGSRKPPIELGKTGESGRVSAAWRARRLAVAQVGRVGAYAGSGFGGLADQAFAGWPGDGVGDVRGVGLEVDLVPEDGECFADADAGAEHERDEVGEVSRDGVFIGGREFVQEGDVFGSECSGWVLGLGFDGVDFAGGVDGEGAVADGEFHRVGDDGAAGSGGGGAGVVLDVGEDGVEALGGGFTDVEFADGGT